MKKRILSLLLCGAMLFSLCPQSVLAEGSAQDSGQITAAGGLCEHHTGHDADCGYTGGSEEVPCTHEHNEDCYTYVTECVHEHNEDCYPEEAGDSVSGNDVTPSDAEEREPENCPHICDEDSGCISKELNCRHEHDDECGYVPATEGTPCQYVCGICTGETEEQTENDCICTALCTTEAVNEDCPVCGAEDAGLALCEGEEPATPSNAETVTVASVQAMIDDLPNADEITDENAEEVKEQLEVIDEAKAQLSDEETDELDFSRYIDVAAALEQLLYGTATPSNALMLLSDYDGPAIVLGTGGITGYSDTNSYDYIYFGDWTVTNNYTTSGPIKWRVLDTKTNMENATEGDGLFLLSDALYTTWLGVTFQKSYHTYNNIYHKGSEPSDGDHTDCLMMNAWQGSDAQKWCSDFYSEYLTTQEQNAVLATTKSDEEFTITITNAISTYQRKFDASENILNEDKVFFLSVEEAKNENYGFTNDDARVANYDDTALWYNFWWLRSPSASADNYAGIVRYNGSVNTDSASFSRAARPAFNLNPKSVLFISAAAGGKADTAVDGNLTAVGTGTGEWKLTLKDTGRSFLANVNGQTSVSASAGGSVQITYFGAQAGTNEYVSAIIAQGDTILYYGRIAQNSENGTASITIPSGLATGSYTLKVFSEQYNGAYQTDYASDFVDISLSVTGSATPPDPPDPDTTAPKLTAGDATRTSEANATVRFISDEAGTYYYGVVESGAQAPSDLATGGTSGNCVNGNNTIDLATLVGAGAKDIYIIVKDAANNVSDELKISIPAYESGKLVLSPESYDFGNLNEGYIAPSAQTVTITNKSQYLVTLTQPTALHFQIGTLSKTDLSAGETATFTVQPKIGYTKGTYSETITVTGSLHPLDIGGGGIDPWKPGGSTEGNAELTGMTYRAANAITANGQTEDTMTASLSVSFTVNAPLSTDAGVTAVSVNGVAGTIRGTTITVELPHNTTLPTDSSAVSITTADGASKTTPATNDNGATWTFTVTAEDGSTKETYTINVSVDDTHTYGDWQFNGQTHWKECDCGEKIDEADHNAQDDGDCTTAVVCTVCGYVTKAAETSHSFTSYVSNNDATCTEDGTKTAKCDHDGCDKTDTRTDSGSAKGHKFGDWITVSSPTCTDKGAQQRTCSECGFKETRNVNPNGHTWEDDYTIDKAATCTEDGSRSIHCKNCDVVKDSEVIPKTGHTYGELIAKKPATYSATGMKAHYICSQCNGYFDENKDPVNEADLIIPKLTGSGSSGDDSSSDGSLSSDDGSSSNGSSSSGDGSSSGGGSPSGSGSSSGGGSSDSGSGDSGTSGWVQRTGSPQTGDNSHMGLWLFILCTSAGALAALLIFKRRKDEENSR